MLLREILLFLHILRPCRLTGFSRHLPLFLQQPPLPVMLKTGVLDDKNSLSVLSESAVNMKALEHSSLSFSISSDDECGAFDGDVLNNALHNQSIDFDSLPLRDDDLVGASALFRPTTCLPYAYFRSVFDLPPETKDTDDASPL